MKRQQMTGNLMLIATAFIWGCAFVAQSVAMDSVGPWTFTCVRSWIAGFVLLAVIRFLDSAGLAVNDWKGALKPGIIVGLALTAASMLQQIGIQYTTVGKAGFITALYVVLVPIFSSLLGRKVSSRIWISAGIAAFGLYLLCMQGGFSLSQRLLSIPVRNCICSAYSCHRFFPESRWGKNVVHSVLHRRNCHDYSDARSGTSGSQQPPCGSRTDSLCRHPLKRSRLYAADSRTETCRSFCGKHPDEPGIGIQRLSRVPVSASGNVSQGISRLCADVRSNCPCTDSRKENG